MIKFLSHTSQPLPLPTVIIPAIIQKNILIYILRGVYDQWSSVIDHLQEVQKAHSFSYPNATIECTVAISYNHSNRQYTYYSIMRVASMSTLPATFKIGLLSPVKSKF